MPVHTSWSSSFIDIDISPTARWHRLGTAATQCLQLPCEGQGFCAPFFKVVSEPCLAHIPQIIPGGTCERAPRSRERRIRESQGKGLDRDPNAGLGVVSAKGCHRRVFSGGVLQKFPSNKRPSVPLHDWIDFVTFSYDTRLLSSSIRACQR